MYKVPIDGTDKPVFIRFLMMYYLGCMHKVPIDDTG